MSDHPVDPIQRGKWPTCQDCHMLEGLRIPWQGVERPHILFISDYPRWEDATKGAFKSGAGFLFKKTMQLVKHQVTKGDQEHPISLLSFHVGYGALCGFTDKESKIKPTTTDLKRCFWRDLRINQLRPQMIVPMGKLACQSLGIQVDNFKKTRGRATTATIHGVTYPVYPTLHPAAPYIQPGLVSLFMKDLRAILLQTATGSAKSAIQLQHLIMKYQYPDSAAELKQLTEEVLAYGTETKLLALDTETNTLDMHLDTSKCIAFSVAWDKGLSASWLMNHKHLTATKGSEEWWMRLPYVFNLTMCAKPKVLHHAKFDFKVLMRLVALLVQRYSTDVAYREYFVTECNHTIEEIQEAHGIINFSYDTMLGEHATNEDVRGYYDLKSVVSIHCPDFYGYEEMLRQEKGVEYHLRTLSDFKSHVETLPEIADRRIQLSTIEGWVSAHEELFPDDTLSVPYEVLTSIRERGIPRSVEAVWELVKALSGAKFKEVKKQAIAHYGESTLKAEWPMFRKDAKLRKIIYKSSGIDAKLQEWVEWYLWFQRHKQKDLLQKEVVATAKTLKVAVEVDRSTVNFENYAPDDLLKYAAIDTDTVLYAADGQIRAMSLENQEVPAIEYANAGACSSSSCLRDYTLPTSSVLAKMEYAGIALDYAYMDELEVKLRAQEEETHERIFELLDRPKVVSGVPVNLGSTDQLAALLHSCGYSEYLTEKTPKGHTRVSKDVLLQMSKGITGGGYGTTPVNKIPIAQLDLAQTILLYRESIKARSAFLGNFRKFGDADGRLHPSFHQTGTVTTRLSATKPALQTIPQFLARMNIKRCMVATSDDYVIMDVDAAGCELRVAAAYLAQMLGEHRGQNIIRNMVEDPYGYDLHSQYTATIFAEELGLDTSTPEKWEKAYHWVREHKDDKSMPHVKKLRTYTKRLIFSLMYGSSEYGIAHLLSIPVDEALEIMQKFFAAEPGIPAYIAWASNFAATHKYITNIFGFRRRFPLAKLDYKHEARTKRQAINFLIQSTANLLWLAGICEFMPVLENELGGRALLTVHDSIVFEIPKYNLRKAIGLLDQCFTEFVARQFPWFPVMFLVDKEAGSSYGVQYKANEYADVLEKGGVIMAQPTDEDERDVPDIRLRLVEEDPDDAHLVDPHGVFDNDVKVT